MAQAQRSLLTAVVFLVAAELVRSAPEPPQPPSGSCRDDICLNDYRGDGTGVDLCEPKARLVQYCPATGDLCLAAPCEERKECVEKGGFCVEDEADCSGRTAPGLCKGHECICCIEGDGNWLTDEFIETSVSVCSGSVSLMPGDKAGVYSPNFPRHYDNDIDCTLEVVVPKKANLKIEFLYFDLEDCEHDSLSINSGSYVLSGSSLPEAIELSGSSTLTFQTDSSVRASGFYLSLEVEAAPYDICDVSSITATGSGVLISPNFPDNYPLRQKCSVTITAPEGSRLSFDWQHFDIEASKTGCSYDFISIYDTNSPSTDRYCGTTPPSFTMSDTNEVSITFISNMEVTKPGFKVIFTVV